ncbi:UNVERIFIED_CONTAM: hypothetical protein FKN15_027337 [Acipenser sinensis]
MPSCPPLSIKVVDLYGEWMTLWEKQFAALNIPHLRSHTLVHTDPLNKKALQEFVIEHERTGELHCLPEHIYIQDENTFFNDNRLGKKDKKKLSANSSLRKSLYFSLPGTKLSMDFFMEQVKKYQLESILVRGTVDRIIPVLEPATDVLQNQCDHKRALYFKVVLQSGEAIESKQVVMATGPTRTQMANIPSWVTAISESYPGERLQHTVQLMHLHNVHQQSPDNDQRQIEPHHTVVFDDGEGIQVENKDPEVAHFVIIAGEPIKEPVVQHGPFVMNTEDEITQAINDFRSGTNGFELAKLWKSKIRNK